MKVKRIIHLLFLRIMSILIDRTEMFCSHVLRIYILLYVSYSYLVAGMFSLQRISQLRLKSVVRSTPVATVALKGTCQNVITIFYT